VQDAADAQAKTSMNLSVPELFSLLIVLILDDAIFFGCFELV
jgi:hypothetical protein